MAEEPVWVVLRSYDRIRQWPSPPTPWVELIYHQYTDYVRYQASRRASLMAIPQILGGRTPWMCKTQIVYPGSIFPHHIKQERQPVATFLVVETHFIYASKLGWVRTRRHA